MPRFKSRRKHGVRDTIKYPAASGAGSGSISGPMGGSDSANKQSAGSDTGTPFMTLSLFILLLAFFVVLNLHSQVDIQRVQPVLKSLERQFARQIQGEIVDPTETADLSEYGSGRAIDLVEAAFQAAAVSFTLRQLDGDDSFVVILSRRDFEQALSQALYGAEVQGEARPGNIYERHARLFTQLSIMLQPQEQALQYQMSVMAHVDTQGRPHRSEIETVTEYKDSLLQLGFPPFALSFGLQPRMRGQVHLYFHPRADIFEGEL